MNVTILYDNTSWKNDLQADWGFSCLIEAYGRTVLFDAGMKGSILIHNIKKLNVDPHSLDLIVISHDHYDHTGGLPAILDINRNATLFMPCDCMISVPEIREIIRVEDACKIAENIYSTGVLKKIEQSLVVKTEKGLVVITGCSHPGVKTILDAAGNYGHVHALIGGLHGFSEYDAIREVDLVCATHCTKHISEIKSRYPDKFVDGGTGKEILI